MPSIVPSRETGQEPVAPKPRGSKPEKGRAGNTRPPSGGAGTPAAGGSSILLRLMLVLALAVAGVACAWAYQLQQALDSSAAQMERYAKRISDLEDRLSDTDEGLSQNTQAMAVKIKELYSEVDKLWASAWRRNKAAIEELEKTSASQVKKVAAAEKTLAANAEQIKSASGDIARLKSVAGDLERGACQAEQAGAGKRGLGKLDQCIPRPDQPLDYRSAVFREEPAVDALYSLNRLQGFLP